MDLFGPMPISKGGYKYVGVLTDGFTKYVVGEPMRDTSAAEAARVFIKWVLIYGSPKRLLTDRGTNFTSMLLKEVCVQLGVVKVFTAPHHHQSVGQAERMVGTLSRMLRAWYEKDKEWKNCCPMLFTPTTPLDVCTQVKCHTFCGMGGCLYPLWKCLARRVSWLTTISIWTNVLLVSS